MSHHNARVVACIRLSDDGRFRRIPEPTSCPPIGLALHTITDPENFEEYRVNVGPMIVRHGGRYITKIGSHKILQTAPPAGPRRDHRFPDIAALNAWYNSAEYQPLIALRQSSADMDKETLITLEGV
jgi:uncharacterized protein (DUF1330 family)